MLHTAEVVVPPHLLGPTTEAGDGGAEEGAADGAWEAWRSALVEAEAAQGCDSAFDAWWVPDSAVDACPLFAAVRAGLVSEAELSAAEQEGRAAHDVLRTPIVQAATTPHALVRILCFSRDCPLGNALTSCAPNAQEAAARHKMACLLQ